MMRPRIRATGGVLLLAMGAMLLGACGRSPSTRFFTLAAVRPDTGRRAFAGAPVQLRAVHIPALLDRPERVVGRSQHQLDIIETQQWGGPLGDMIRRVLTEDLFVRLPSGMVLMANSPQPPGTHGVVVDIEEFQPDVGGNVVLDASWVIDAPGGRTFARGQRRWQLGSGAGADAQVAAMSTLLGRLADAIVASVRSAAS